MASRQMLTVKELMQNTPRDVRTRSKQTMFSVTKIWKKNLKNDKTALIFNSKSIAATEKVYYDQTVVLYPDYYEITTESGEEVKQFEVPNLDHLCWVHCTCPYFMFYNEWVLSQHGNTTLTNSINRPPHITNPGQLAYVCKHLYRGLPDIVNMMRQLSKGSK